MNLNLHKRVLNVLEPSVLKILVFIFHLISRFPMTSHSSAIARTYIFYPSPESFFILVQMNLFWWKHTKGCIASARF